MIPLPAPAPKADGFTHAQRLAQAGRAECRACKRQLPMEGAVTLNYGKAVVLAICPDCFGKLDVHLSRCAEGINVEIVPRSLLLLP